MHRRTVYAGATPLETDILWNARYGMTALALLAQDILGTSTLVFGAPVGPTTPSASLAVFVGAGRIYSMAPLEPSAWSSLAADTTSVLKQGILGATGATVACPVLGTTGQSTNYLIEGQYQENDTNLLALSYWNADNPEQPFSGAGNNGIAQPTMRSGQLVVQAKAGTPATTGTQTTPAVDAGWVPLAVVTVAFGATTITSGNIVVASGAPYTNPVASVQSVHKVLSTSRTSNTVLADPDLALTLASGFTYAVRALVKVTAGGAGGVQALLNYLGTSSVAQQAATGRVNSTTFVPSAETTMNSFIYGNAATAAGDFAVIEGIITTTSAALLSVNWAQNTSNGTATVIGPGSYLTATVIN